METSKCIAITKNGNSCRYQQKYGQYCGQHKAANEIIEVKKCITITYGDVCENHVGMQKIQGNVVTCGFSLDELQRANERFTKLGAVCELYVLGDALPTDLTMEYESAYVLIIRQGVDVLLKEIDKTSNDMMVEQE